MTRQQMVVAAMVAAYDFGLRAQAWSLSDKAGITHSDLLKAFNPAVFQAFEAVELVETITMKGPDNPATTYRNLAYRFSHTVRETKKLPTSEELSEIVEKAVLDAYRPMMNLTQVEQFQKKWKEIDHDA